MLPEEGDGGGKVKRSRDSTRIAAPALPPVRPREQKGWKKIKDVTFPEALRGKKLGRTQSGVEISLSTKFKAGGTKGRRRKGWNKITSCPLQRPERRRTRTIDRLRPPIIKIGAKRGGLLMTVGNILGVGDCHHSGGNRMKRISKGGPCLGLRQVFQTRLGVDKFLRVKKRILRQGFHESASKYAELMGEKKGGGRSKRTLTSQGREPIPAAGGSADCN